MECVLKSVHERRFRYSGILSYLCRRQCCETADQKIVHCGAVFGDSIYRVLPRIYSCQETSTNKILCQRLQIMSLVQRCMNVADRSCCVEAQHRRSVFVLETEQKTLTGT